MTQHSLEIAASAEQSIVVQPPSLPSRQWNRRDSGGAEAASGKGASWTNAAA